VPPFQLGLYDADYYFSFTPKNGASASTSFLEEDFEEYEPKASLQ
jgi:hypothetical protein